ncbi:MAG: ABC-2 family transporter protein [Myxococcota bacterium]
MGTRVGVGDGLRVYAALTAANVRSHMQYRGSFALLTAFDFLIIVADLAPVYLMVRYFGTLEGWSFAELGLLYGMVGLSWGIVETALRGFADFGAYLVQGDLDRWLLRPRSILLQVAAHQFEARKLGRILQAGLVLVLAVFFLELPVSSLPWVLLGVAGGLLFFAGIVLLGAASQFWTLGQTSELQNMLTYGGSAALIYPVSIYSRWFRRVLTYGVPLAFVNYFPALAVLGRTEAAGWPAWLPALSPLVCAAVLLLGAAAFSRGLRRYESTGT